MEPNFNLHSPPLIEPCVEVGSSPSPQEQDSNPSIPWSQVPSSSLIDPEWFEDEHIQAKRARVETIVRGMGLPASPLGLGSSRARAGPYCLETARERKRKQSVPMQQGHLQSGPARDWGGRKGGPRVREELQLLKQQLKDLQEHLLQEAKPRDAAQGPIGFKKGHSPLNIRQRNCYGAQPWAKDSSHQQGSSGDLSKMEGHRASGLSTQAEEPRLLPPEAQELLATLHKELTRAMSQAVDSVLQKVLLDPAGHLAQLSTNFQGLVEDDAGQPCPPEPGASKDPSPLAAWPRKAPPQGGHLLGNFSRAKLLESSRIIPSLYQGSPASQTLTVPAHIQESQLIRQLLGYGPKGHWSGGFPQDSAPQTHACSELVLHPGGALQLQHPLSFTPPTLEGLPLLSSVKMEGGLQAVAGVPPFPLVHIQEGLNPAHLKKAKLMFFFTRYPSSNLLKDYFPDVQFNRCITSQMIKWFSNFREFYYIQMEKSARQAISDGVTNAQTLAVFRDSELFRTLNMHYNKGNDFEVSTCFLEIASLTLQEFFRAVSMGKDSEPSWKKPIYKIISKLDSDIPEIFKSSNYPQELF
ncbi:prospero homeobox protein 2 [Suncus etruscus]|uniref:prospero homeobox protein 2 n=1 Tax=Suncus etruscus TaxID=109475 RepID=UPI002110323A|nr:prospero homeobox protein 2 [Suncus etruscus]